MDYKELKRRVTAVRLVLQQSKATPPPGSPFSEALQEAEELADGIVSQKPATDENVEATILQASVIWNLYDILVKCQAAGLNREAHLRNMNAGTTDFGKPAFGPNHNHLIYFKDFEFELLVAAKLSEKAAAISFAATPNDPRFDILADGLWISVKHPNSAKQLGKQLAGFQQLLERDGEYGLFAIAIEDIAALANDQDPIFRQKAFAELTDLVLQRAHARARIVGVIVTSSALSINGEFAQFRRVGKAAMFRRSGAGVPIAAA